MFQHLNMKWAAITLLDKYGLLLCLGYQDRASINLSILTREYETYFYYLCTAEKHDYISSLHDADDEILIKENYTLLEYLKHYVEQKTKKTRFIDFYLDEEEVDKYITGRLLQPFIKIRL